MSTNNTIGVFCSESCGDGYVKILKSDYKKLLYHYDISSYLEECNGAVNTLEYQVAKFAADINSKAMEMYL
jgi:hypothetical protein